MRQCLVQALITVPNTINCHNLFILDKAMQLNQSRFRLNGYCGYVLRPECMFRPDYDPTDASCLLRTDYLVFTIKVIAARHLQRSSRGMVSPFVEVEILGADYDTGIKLTTKTLCKINFLFTFFSKILYFCSFCPQAVWKYVSNLTQKR